MKSITVLALIIVALQFVACAHHDDTSTTTTSSDYRSTSSYSK